MWKNLGWDGVLVIATTILLVFALCTAPIRPPTRGHAHTTVGDPPAVVFYAPPRIDNTCGGNKIAESVFDAFLSANGIRSFSGGTTEEPADEDD
jgi:hypothetical protein